jgi:hypothetical protein
MTGFKTNQIVAVLVKLDAMTDLGHKLALPDKIQ